MMLKHLNRQVGLLRAIDLIASAIILAAGVHLRMGRQKDTDKGSPEPARR